MRVGIDNISTGESTGTAAPGGMRAYLCSLVARFARLRTDYQFLVFSAPDFEPCPDLPSNVRIVRLSLIPRNRGLRTVYQQTLLPLFIACYRLDVFFEIATICPLLLPVPTVLTVQFLQMFKEGAAGYGGRFRTAYLKVLLPFSVRKAKSVIIFTESSRAELVQLMRIGKDKVHVIHHGLNPDILAQPGGNALPLELGMHSGAKYIVFVSATYWYKNHITLIRSFAKFARRHDEPYLLVLAGAEIDVSYAALRKVAEECGVSQSVLILGRVQEVAPLYWHAVLSVFPSLSETFGFPVLEAMACGCPVITSRSGSMAELGGDAALLIDPLNEDEMADAIRKVAADPVLRARMVEQGLAWARNFTWDETARKTLGLIEAAAGATKEERRNV